MLRWCDSEVPTVVPDRHQLVNELLIKCGRTSKLWGQHLHSGQNINSLVYQESSQLSLTQIKSCTRPLAVGAQSAKLVIVGASPPTARSEIVIPLRLQHINCLAVCFCPQLWILVSANVYMPTALPTLASLSLVALLSHLVRS